MEPVLHVVDELSEVPLVGANEEGPTVLVAVSVVIVVTGAFF